MGSRRRRRHRYVVREAGRASAPSASTPTPTPEEALAYYERKFAELAGQVSLLEQRVRGGAPAQDVVQGRLARSARAVATANAVGDLAGFAERLGRLGRDARRD